jgi:SAM-dependent methyltransferase
MEIANTGERILLEKETPMMIARHFCAYKFAKEYSRNKSVLDIGCGEGYGSFYLASFAKQVVAIDYNQEIIDFAKNKYPKDNLSFYVQDIEKLNSLQNKFNLICSFQVIEHIADAKKLLGSINNLLHEGGIFICSTPNRLDASPDSQVPLNKFHLKEYLLDEFKELLEADFGKVEIYGLKRSRRLNFYRRLKKIGLFNFLPCAINPVMKYYNRIDYEDFIILKDRLDASLDFIAVCSRR